MAAAHSSSRCPMTRSTVALFALLLAAASAGAAAPPFGDPLPKGAKYAYVGRDWVVQYVEPLVPGTERTRPPPSARRYFLCRPGSPWGRPFLEEKTTSGEEHRLAVTPDGSVLFCGHEGVRWF